MPYELPVRDVILQFTLVVSVALVIQLTLERSRIPGIVGLLLVGMIIGPGGLGMLPEEPVIELLGTIGLLGHSPITPRDALLVLTENRSVRTAQYDRTWP